MTTETDLVRRFAKAQGSGAGPAVDQELLAALDRPAAYRIQAAVMQALGTPPAMFKVAIAADGDGVIAPIYAGRVGDSGALKLPASRVGGLEVEVCVVLGRDLPAGSDRAAVEAAVGQYRMGVEICGTRFADRAKASYDAWCADNMSAFGYAIDPHEWERGTNLAGVEIDLSFNGATIFAGPARHGFGGVLEALAAYAKLARQPYPLTAGTIVTTGSLCGLVATSGPGKGVARMGGHTVTVELT